MLSAPAPPASIIIRLADPVLLGRSRSPRDRTGVDNIGWPLTLELGGGLSLYSLSLRWPLLPLGANAVRGPLGGRAGSGLGEHSRHVTGWSPTCTRLGLRRPAPPWLRPLRVRPPSHCLESYAGRGPNEPRPVDPGAGLGYSRPSIALPSVSAKSSMLYHVYTPVRLLLLWEVGSIVMYSQISDTVHCC